MMMFRIVNTAIQTLLGANAQGKFRVIGYQGQGQDASEVKSNSRVVQTFYSTGDFSKQGGRYTGPTQHDMTFNISLTASAASTVDLNTINNPNATPSQIATALTAMQEGAYRADVMIDELMELVYQILMDALNVDLGLPKGTVSNRWIGTLKKDEPQPMGSLVILTGVVTFDVRCVEQVLGDVPVPLQSILTTLETIAGDLGAAEVIPTTVSEINIGQITSLAPDGIYAIKVVNGQPVLEIINAV